MSINGFPFFLTCENGVVAPCLDLRGATYEQAFEVLSRLSEACRMPALTNQSPDAEKRSDDVVKLDAGVTLSVTESNGEQFLDVAVDGTPLGYFGNVASLLEKRELTAKNIRAGRSDVRDLLAGVAESVQRKVASDCDPVAIISTLLNDLSLFGSVRIDWTEALIRVNSITRGALVRYLSSSETVIDFTGAPFVCSVVQYLTSRAAKPPDKEICCLTSWAGAHDWSHCPQHRGVYMDTVTREHFKNRKKIFRLLRRHGVETLGLVLLGEGDTEILTQLKTSVLDATTIVMVAIIDAKFNYDKVTRGFTKACLLWQQGWTFSILTLGGFDREATASPIIELYSERVSVVKILTSYWILKAAQKKRVNRSDGLLAEFRKEGCRCWLQQPFYFY